MRFSPSLLIVSAQLLGIFASPLQLPAVDDLVRLFTKGPAEFERPNDARRKEEAHELIIDDDKQMYMLYVDYAHGHQYGSQGLYDLFANFNLNAGENKGDYTTEVLYFPFAKHDQYKEDLYLCDSAGFVNPMESGHVKMKSNTDVKWSESKPNRYQAKTLQVNGGRAEGHVELCPIFLGVHPGYSEQYVQLTTKDLKRIMTVKIVLVDGRFVRDYSGHNYNGGPTHYRTY